VDAQGSTISKRTRMEDVAREAAINYHVTILEKGKEVMEIGRMRLGVWVGMFWITKLKKKI